MVAIAGFAGAICVASETETELPVTLLRSLLPGRLKSRLPRRRAQRRGRSRANGLGEARRLARCARRL